MIREQAFWEAVRERGWMRYMLGLNMANIAGVIVCDMRGTDTKLVEVVHPPGVQPWYSPPPCVVMWS